MEIAVAFDYEGVWFEGTLSRPSGGGSAWWLTINDYCRGQLVKQCPGRPGESLPQKWYFYSNDNWFEDIAWYLGEVVDTNTRTGNESESPA